MGGGRGSRGRRPSNDYWPMRGYVGMQMRAEVLSAGMAVAIVLWEACWGFAIAGETVAVLSAKAATAPKSAKVTMRRARKMLTFCDPSELV